MRTIRAMGVMAVGLGGVAAATAAGCFDFADQCELALDCPSTSSGSSSSSTGTGGDGGTPPGCTGDPTMDPTLVTGDCGVFASAGASPGGDGSQASPRDRLQAAVDQASSTGKWVFACADASLPFAEEVALPAGVAVYGGFDCATWTWSEAARTKLTAGAGKVPLTLASGPGTTLVQNLAVTSADATAPGASSIAVIANGATATLARCDLVAGAGAKGADGDPGDPNGNAAAAGMPGNGGADACMGDVVNGNPGGSQVTNDCGGGDVSIGGDGGKGNQLNGSNGQPGLVGAFGAAGVGEPPAGAWSCNGSEPNGAGDGGEDGDPGDPGPGATGLGTLSASGYVGIDGDAGLPGTPGQGGGGGGGAKGGAAICSNMPGAGASGGSGGAGGCGGKPGTGGKAGGASIALVSLQATITLSDCKLTAGKGGDGGKGGDLQPGGLGGDGGKGGAPSGGSKAACDGGKGGQGGNGGPGGGGLGGPSLAVAYQGNPATKLEATMLTLGTPGSGGLGGSGNVAANAGDNGVAVAEQVFP